MTTEEPEHDETKLPLWAQTELRDLRSYLRAAQQELDVHHHQVDPSSVEMVRPALLGNIWVPDGCYRFHVSPSPHWPSADAYVDVKREEGGLGVEIRGSNAVSINPTASNQLSVEIRR